MLIVAQVGRNVVASLQTCVTPIARPVGKLAVNAASTRRSPATQAPRPAPDELLVYVPCPLCGSRDERFLMHSCDRLFGRSGWYRIVQCGACGMKYLNPRPGDEALLLHYPDDYLPVRIPEQMPALTRRLLSAFLDLRWLASILEIERVIGRIPANAQVVDVGSGVTGMLARLQRFRSCPGLAVDINPAVVAHVRTRLGMPAFHGTLRQAHLGAETVDLVTMNEYLEHEPEPVSVLQEARRISRPGAHLVVEVPCIDGLVPRVFRSCWSQLDVPRHLAFYTPETLGKMLAQCGYRPLQVRRFGAPFSIGISLMQCLGFKELGRMGPFEALLFALASAPFLPFFPWLREFMLVVARAE
jgi:SAM-dependent methyltransferase